MHSPLPNTHTSFLPLCVLSQAGLMTLNFGSSCFCLPGANTTGTYHHTQYLGALGTNLGHLGAEGTVTVTGDTGKQVASFQKNPDELE